MCAGCMGTADFLLTGGVLGAASLKVAGRRLIPGRRHRGKVTDAEAAEFVSRLRTGAGPDAGPAETSPSPGVETGTRGRADAEPATASSPSHPG